MTFMWLDGGKGNGMCKRSAVRLSPEFPGTNAPGPTEAARRGRYRDNGEAAVAEIGVSDDDILSVRWAEVVDEDGARRGPAGYDRGVRLALLGQAEVRKPVDDGGDGRLIVARVEVRLIGRHSGRVGDRARDPSAYEHLDRERRRTSSGDGAERTSEGPGWALDARVAIRLIRGARRQRVDDGDVRCIERTVVGDGDRVGQEPTGRRRGPARALPNRQVSSA